MKKSDLQLLDVIVDSTAFKADKSRSSYGFTVLSRLASKNKIKLHLSEVNLNEVISSISEEFRAARISVLEKLNSLNAFLSSDVVRFSEDIDAKCDMAIGDFRRWIERNNCTVHPMRNHYDYVFEAYFAGLPPFSSLKNRKDIPDAFVYKTILDVKSKSDNAIFISNDKNLSHNAASLQCGCFESIKDFVESKAVIELVRQLDSEEQRDEIVKKIERVKNVISDRVDDVVKGKLSITSEIVSKIIGCRYEDFRATGYVTSAYGARIDSCVVHFNKSAIYISLSGEVNAQIEYSVPSSINRDFDFIDQFDDFHEHENWTESCYMGVKAKRISFEAEIVPKSTLYDLLDKSDEEIFQILKNDAAHISHIEA